jgi:hypothetical protein
MSPRIAPPRYYSLFPWLSEQDQTTQAKLIAEFQDLYSRGMDRALGMQECTLDCAVDLQSTAIDLYKAAPWYSPLVGECFEAGTRFIIFCLEMQMKCLDLLLPVKSGAAAGVPTDGSATTSRAEQALQELAMDIGSGLTKRPASATRSSARTTASC